MSAHSPNEIWSACAIDLLVSITHLKHVIPLIPQTTPTCSSCKIFCCHSMNKDNVVCYSLKEYSTV